MIEINLLPGAKRKRGGKRAGFQLPDVKALAASVKDPWLIATAAGWALFAAFLLAFYTPRKVQVGNLRPVLDSTQREAQRLAAVLQTKAQTEARRDTLLAQINVIRDIDRDRFIWPHIMDAVTKALPPYTWIDELSARTGEGDSVGGGLSVPISVTGKSGDIQAITRFVRNLEESQFLEGATQVSTAVVTDNGRDVYTYVINVRYQQPDTSLLTMQPLAATLVQSYRSGSRR